MSTDQAKETTRQEELAVVEATAMSASASASASTLAPAPASASASVSSASAAGDKCSVCGDKATKLRYSHYGATSCFSCRAFFRRAIEKGNHVSLTCMSPAPGECRVTVATRKKCPACRFQKCLSVGMTHSRERPSSGATTATVAVTRSQSGLSSRGSASAEALATARREDDDEDEESPFALSCYDNGEEPVQFPVVPTSSVPEVASLCGTFTQKDWFILEEISRLDRTQSYHIGAAVGEVTKAVLKSFAYAACNGTTLEFSAICWAYSVGIKKLVRFAQSLEDFISLTHLLDKKSLLLHNLDPMFNIRVGHFFTCGEQNFLHQMEKLSIFDISFFKKSSDWLPQIAPMKWDQFFRTPWANSEQHEQKFESLMGQIRNLEMDSFAASLFTIIVLFSTDQVVETDFTGKKALEDIDRIKEKYSALLFRYLCHSRGASKAHVHFALYSAAVRSLREMSDIMKNKTIKVTTEWPQLEDLV